MIATLAGNVGRKLTEGVEEDPVAWLVKTLLRFGSALLIAGFVLGTVGYFLKASATSAANNEKIVLGNIGTIFSNIKAPNFSPAPMGTAPVTASIQGVQNFFDDAWQEVQGAASDVAQIGSVIGTLAEDAGAGLADIAKAFVAFVMHFPDILWNGLVWGVGGAIADVLNWLFPWLVILGAALLIIGLMIHAVRWLWDATIGAAWKSSFAKWSERVRTRAEALFDRIAGNSDVGKAPGSLPGALGRETSRLEGKDAVGLIPASPAVLNPSSPEKGPSFHQVGENSGSFETVTGLASGNNVSGSSAVGSKEPISERGDEVLSDSTGNNGSVVMEQNGAEGQSAVNTNVDIGTLPLQQPPTKRELENVLGSSYDEAKDRMRAALRTGHALSPTSSSA